MLVAAASPGPSSIHGNGLIAREFLAAGTMIWRFVPDVDREMSEGEVAGLPEAERREVLGCAHYQVNARRFLVPGDAARFLNHDGSPNAVRTFGGITARRDIQSGEEITVDYRRLVVLTFPATLQACSRC